MTEEGFIESVENVIPNPPFKINIITTSHNKIRDENSFKGLTTFALKDFTWKKNENIRTFEISLNNYKIGIIGSATVAVLESHGKPVSRVDLNTRNVEIEGITYTLERNIQLSQNSILEVSKSITINDEGEINEDSSTVSFTNSNSRLSLHVIEIPSSLFPDSWRRKENQVKISWPFPLLLVIDISGNRDLDLNSPRT